MTEWIVTLQRRNKRQTEEWYVFNTEEAARTQYDYAKDVADRVRISKVVEAA